MNPYTSPATQEEIARARKFREQGFATVCGHYTANTRYIDENISNPTEMDLDWLAISREFS